MTHWKLAISSWAVLAWGAGCSAALAENFDQQQLKIIKDTASSICDGIREARGQKSDIQLQGEVKADLGGLVGKVFNVGGSGKGSLSREEFEGLSREATAAALEGDRGCRERVFNKMFDKLEATPHAGQNTPTSPSQPLVLPPAR